MAGILTLANFRTELTYLLEGRAGIGDARLDRWVNQIYRHVSMPNIHKHWELEEGVEIRPLTENVASYDISTTASYVERPILSINAVKYQAYEQLQNSGLPYLRVLKRRTDQWMAAHPKTATGGGPQYYTIIRNKLKLRPLPDASVVANNNSVTLEVYMEPAALATDSDVTVLLPWWDEVILMGAKWLAEIQLGFMEYAEQSRQAYLELIRTAPNRTLEGLHEEETLMAGLNSGEPYMDQG